MKHFTRSLEVCECMWDHAMKIRGISFAPYTPIAASGYATPRDAQPTRHLLCTKRVLTNQPSKLQTAPLLKPNHEFQYADLRTYTLSVDFLHLGRLVSGTLNFLKRWKIAISFIACSISLSATPEVVN